MASDGRNSCPECGGIMRCKKKCPRTFPPKDWDRKGDDDGVKPS